MRIGDPISEGRLRFGNLRPFNPTITKHGRTKMRKLVDGVALFQTEAYARDESLFHSLASGQSPLALFITCSDSRIDPNLLTQTKPGELFVQRTAGNIVPPYDAGLGGGESATIEYAVRALKVADIIICGHSHCGAMQGLLHPDALESLPAVKAYLAHANAALEGVGDSEDAGARLAQAIECNVVAQIENMKTHPAVAEALDAGELQLHGWVYTFESGQVAAYDPQANQFQSLCR